MIGRVFGFSLVEVVVALSILASGLLAVASGLAAVSRLTAEGRHLTRVAALAERRFDLLRQEGCASSGVEVLGPDSVWWGGTPVSGGRQALVVVSRLTARGRRVDSLGAFQRCPS